MIHRCGAFGNTINGVPGRGRPGFTRQAHVRWTETWRVKATPLSGGYTLVEMMIAMVLVATLMSVAWGIMSMYNSLLTAGQSQTTEQQLVRSLFQILSEDLSAVSLKSDEHSSPLPGSQTSGLVPALEFDADEFSPFADVSGIATVPYDGPARMTLTGTSAAIRVTVRRPAAQTMTTPSDIDLLNELGGGSQSVEGPQESRGVQVAEFQTVVYQLQPFGQTEGISSLPSGLYRLQTDAVELMELRSQRSTIEQSLSIDDVSINRSTLESLLFPQNDALRDEQVDAENSSAPSYELIPEVVGCRFQVF